MKVIPTMTVTEHESDGRVTVQIVSARDNEIREISFDDLHDFFNMAVRHCRFHGIREVNMKLSEVPLNTYQTQNN